MGVNAFSNAEGSGPALRVSIERPSGVEVAAEPGVVQSPGPPGSIEKGPREPRGFMLRATAPAAAAFGFDVKMEILTFSVVR